MRRNRDDFRARMRAVRIDGVMMGDMTEQGGRILDDAAGKGDSLNEALALVDAITVDAEFNRECNPWAIHTVKKAIEAYR